VEFLDARTHPSGPAAAHAVTNPVTAASAEVIVRFHSFLFYRELAEIGIHNDTCMRTSCAGRFAQISGSTTPSRTTRPTRSGNTTVIPSVNYSTTRQPKLTVCEINANDRAIPSVWVLVNGVQSIARWTHTINPRNPLSCWAPPNSRSVRAYPARQLQYPYTDKYPG
jgi:hypothetical protein